jgi:hypothetical protein
VRDRARRGEGGLGGLGVQAGEVGGTGQVGQGRQHLVVAVVPVVPVVAVVAVALVGGAGTAESAGTAGGAVRAAAQERALARALAGLLLGPEGARLGQFALPLVGQRLRHRRPDLTGRRPLPGQPRPGQLLPEGRQLAAHPAGTEQCGGARGRGDPRGDQQDGEVGTH